MNRTDKETRRWSLSDGQLERIRDIWEVIAPHPTVADHPFLSIALTIGTVLYWYLGSPIVDFFAHLSTLVSLLQAIWDWALPATVQTLFRTYPGARLVFLLLFAGLAYRVHNQGAGYVVNEDIAPAVSSLGTVIVKIPIVVTGGIASVVAENREFISDILSGLISSLIFKVLIALGVVGAVVSFITGGF